MKSTKKIKIDDTIYMANTDYRYAIKCNKIAIDDTIGDLERALAIICTIFGPQGLDNKSHYEKLLNWITSYLACGKEIEKNNTPDMDYIQDWDYIVASFQSDYGINLEEIDMDWYRFNNLINGLSNSDIGNCCILNRVRNLRNFDLSTITDSKEKEKIRKAKKEVALKKNIKAKTNRATFEQKESAKEFYQELFRKE